MSTRESIAAREAHLVRAPAKSGASATPSSVRVRSSPLLFKLVYLTSDLVAVVVAHLLAVRIVEHFLHVPTSALNPFEYHRYYIPFFGVVLYIFEGYKSPELRRPEQELERSCKAVAVSFLGLVLFNFVVFRSESFSRYLLAAWFVLALFLLLFVRFVLRGVYGALWRAGLCRRRALLIGSTAGLSEYQQLLSIQRHRAYDLVGALLVPWELDSTPVGMPNVRTLGALDQWREFVFNTSADVLIVAPGDTSDDEKWVRELLHDCKRLRIDVELYSRLLATANSNYEHDEFTGCFRFYATPQWSFTTQRFIKRAMDLGIGLIGSIVTLLLTPFIWLLVNLESRGPLFYRSAYLAQNGTIQYYLKFRTMLVNADHILEKDSSLRSRFSEKQKLMDDPRVTRIGRFLRRYSMDELPQFFSVVKGDLSLVGPRTIRREEGERYGPMLDKLLSCRPGLTGFWQVMGRQTTSYHERVLMDMFYVERWSVWLDLVIIAKTFWTVVKAEGAY